MEFSRPKQSRSSVKLEEAYYSGQCQRLEAFWVWLDIIDASLKGFPKFPYHLLDSQRRMPSYVEQGVSE